MRPRSPRAHLLGLLLLAACMPSAPAMEPSEPPEPVDPWDALPKTAEWVYATGGFAGDHPAECREVSQWIEAEARCRGSLCRHAKELAGDWVARCKGVAPELLAKVNSLYTTFQLRARSEPSECGAQEVQIEERGCGEDRSCQATAEDWATRCGASDGSPLVVHILERTVEHRIGPKARVSLDDRSCEALRTTLGKQALCFERAPCEEAERDVMIFKRRCQKNDERPSLGLAVIEASIAGGVEFQPAGVAYQPGTPGLRPAELPFMLDDGEGAMLYVCEERVRDAPGAYVRRKACKNSHVRLAHAVVTGGGAEVRVAEIEFPSDAEFRRRFPAIQVAGEAELRERDRVAEFAAELEKVTPMGKEGVGPMAALLSSFAAEVARSAPFRASLRAKDEPLVALFRELGRQKAAAGADRKLSPLDLAGLGNRAMKRPFADVKDDGAVEVGALGRASELDLDDALPRALGAYRDGVRGLAASARRAKADLGAAALARTYAAEQARACAEAEKAIHASQEALFACVFRVETCNGERLDALIKAADDGRAAAVAARHQITLAETGPGASVEAEIEQKAAEAGCVPPWW